MANVNPNVSTEESDGGPVPRTEPDIEALTKALRWHVDRYGGVTAGVAATLRAERGWTGRLIDILEVFSQSAEQLGYMSGGRRPEEVATWLALWSDSPLSVDQIRLVADAGGWDPDPFVVVAREGLLETLLRLPDGSVRRVRGERAGGWVSDELAIADDTEIIAAVHRVIDADKSVQGS